MLDPILKFIELIKDLNCKRALGLFVVCVSLILVYKVDVFLPYIDKHFNVKQETKKPKTIIVTSEDLDISAFNRSKIEEYVEQYINPIIDKLIFASVYKYMPEGPEYQYQGRILVQTKKTGSNNELLIKELGIGWVPLWSGRNVNAILFEEQPTMVRYDKTLQSFQILNEGNYKNSLHQIPSINIPILVELGVTHIYYYPIVKGQRTIGYISFYLANVTPEIELTLESVGRNLASRISLYLVED